MTTPEELYYLEDHSYPMAVDTPEDISFAEWICSPHFSRFRFVKEAKALNVNFHSYVINKYKEYQHAAQERP